MKVTMSVPIADEIAKETCEDVRSTMMRAQHRRNLCTLKLEMNTGLENCLMAKTHNGCVIGSQHP